MSDLGFFLAVVVSVFALVDPFGALPFFVALTEGFDAADRQHVATRSVIILGTVLGAFALVGRFVFEAFGFTLAAFEIAGGALLFLVAFEMLQGEVTRSKLTAQDRADALARRDEIAVVPLGIPLLAGPGAISTVMIYEGNAGSDLLMIAATFVAIGVTTASSWLILRYGPSILHRMGRPGIMVLTRVMGLLLAAVGVQFILNGLLATFPGL